MVKLSGEIDECVPDQGTAMFDENPDLIDEMLPDPGGDDADLRDDEPDDPEEPNEMVLVIIDLEAKCAAAEEVVTACKAELREAKVHYDNCVVRLREYIRGMRNDRDRPLFDQPAPALEDDSWREFLLEELKLPAGILKSLAADDVVTVGQLEDLRADITLGRSQWPKGIGPAKIDLIETVVIEWIASYQTDDIDAEEAEEGS
jgi:hypothetical protein